MFLKPVVIAGAVLFAGSAFAQEPPSFPSNVPGKFHAPPKPVAQQIREKRSDASGQRMQGKQSSTRQKSTRGPMTSKGVSLPANRSDAGGKSDSGTGGGDGR